MDSDVSVVDDSAAIRKILQRVLGQTGMAINTIHEAGDGQQALELLRSERVNLVLTDTNMPRMEGLELLAAIRRSCEWAAVPVVMITTEGEEAKVAEAVSRGPQSTSGSPSRQIKSRRNWPASWSRQCRYECTEPDCKFPPAFRYRGFFHNAQRGHSI